jgi:hypothetical protein
MRLKELDVESPAICKTSFFKVLEKLEVQAKDTDPNVALFAQNLLKETAPYPLLKEGMEDSDLTGDYKVLIDKLCRTLFPDALLSNEIKAITPPFSFNIIYKSSRLESIVDTADGELFHHLRNVTAENFYLYNCYAILGSYYGYPMKAGRPMMIEIADKNAGTKKIYRMAINADMIEFIPTEKSVDIKQEDYITLLDNFDNIDVWKKHFPPNSWIMRGIMIINLMDVTIDQSLSSITSNLLIKSTDSFENIRNGIKSLYDSESIEVGIVTFNENELVPVHKANVNSILLGDNVNLDCTDNMCQFTFNKLIDKKQPLIIPDVEKFHEQSGSSISKRLVELDIKSYIIAPLLYEDELLGFMELSSALKYELNTVSLSRISEILPILAMATKRYKTEMQNHIEAIIQQECTTVHDSVKWRFEAEAQKFMQKQLNNEQPVFKDLIFKDVYPLYGQLDIKNSSLKRNEAVKSDLIRQITEVRKILQHAFDRTNIIAYEELIYRVDVYIARIKKGLSAGSEHQILEFLKSNIYPVFTHLKQSDTELKKRVEKYEDLLDQELHTVYKERKKYDDSVNQINSRLAFFLDTKQTQAQDIFPHYFERYKTDGVEYNMYIGQSISNNETFDPIHLQNLRLWQLVVMCEMEVEYRKIQQELETDIEIASLVLVYNTPLAIHFRMDEKRFDVEGAYNARYEIIKKRVDKAHIKGTKERITQPGYLSIIYSQDEDARLYKNYLEFLQSKNYIKKGYEDLELEDLQGITGLRALRAKVDYSIIENNKEGYSVDELIETISGSSN